MAEPAEKSADSFDEVCKLQESGLSAIRSTFFPDFSEGSIMTRISPPIALALLLAAGLLQAQQGDDSMNSQSPVAGVTSRFIESNGIRMRIFEAGDSGPLVLLAHG